MRRLPLAFALLLLAPVVVAQVYKWTDAQGTVHYSETPPPQGTPYKRMATPTADTQPSVPRPVQRADVAPPAAEPGAAPVADTPENRARLCSSLKANLDLLKGDGAVVMEQQGKSVALDQTQRTEQVALAEKQYGEFCSQK